MAFDAYLFIDTVVGESTATFTTKPNGMSNAPMDIYSFSFGASNPVTIGSGTGGSGGGRVSLSSFNVMKKSDDASPLLFMACANGEHYAKATVVLRKAGGASNKQSVFLEYDFTEVFVESIQWSGSSGGDDTPTESISFAFKSIAITNYKQDATGKLAKGNGASWDVTLVGAAA